MLGFVAALAFVAFAVFVGVTVHEIDYANSHPYAFGPAHVIAWSAGGGALLSGAVGLLAFALARAPRG
jgi:hypothetical protein